jgi:hypothetical protein
MELSTGQQTVLRLDPYHAKTLKALEEMNRSANEASLPTAKPGK